LNGIDSLKCPKINANYGAVHSICAKIGVASGINYRAAKVILAGIQLQVSAGSNVVNGGAGANARWSDAELHASMVNHFSLWQEVPQFKVWQLVA